MNKPELKVKKYLDYFEIKDYIIEKYNCERDEDKTWDYMCDKQGVRNDSYGYIPTESCVNEFTKAVKEEFGENPDVWISW